MISIFTSHQVKDDRAEFAKLIKKRREIRKE